MERAQSETLSDLLEEVALKWPNKEALVIGGERVSYGQYMANARKVAKGLYAMGIRRGDHVGIWMTNRPEWGYCRFGIYRLACGGNQRKRLEL